MFSGTSQSSYAGIAYGYDPRNEGRRKGRRGVRYIQPLETNMCVHVGAAVAMTCIWHHEILDDKLITAAGIETGSTTTTKPPMPASAIKFPAFNIRADMASEIGAFINTRGPLEPVVEL